MTTTSIDRETFPSTRISFDDAVAAYRGAAEPVSQALFAFALALRWAQARDKHLAHKWARTAARLYGALPNTLEVTAEHPTTVFGIIVPDYIHQAVVREHFPEAFASR